MRYLRHAPLRPGWTGLLGLALLLGGTSPGWAQRPGFETGRGTAAASEATTRAPRPGDPVEALSQALRLPTLDADRNPDVLTYRERLLTQRIDALHTIGDMRRGLQLLYWRDAEERDERVANVDAKVRGELLQRFQDAVRNVLRNGRPIDQLAAVDLLGDMGTSDQRAIRPGTARTLTPDLVAFLRRSRDPQLRAATARTLGRINPELAPRRDAPRAETVVSALEDLLRPDHPVVERRAAADALLGLVRVVLQGFRSQTSDAQATRPDLLRVASAVVPAAGQGIDDPDVRVRTLAIQALQQSAAALGELVPNPRAAGEFAPTGRNPSPREREDIQAFARQVADEQKEVRPLSTGLGREASALARRVNDPDPGVRVAARQALEEMAISYSRMQRRAESVPRLPTEPKPPVKEGDKKTDLGRPALLVSRSRDLVLADPPAPRGETSLEDGLLSALPALIEGLRDPDVHARLAAEDAIELLGAKAAPAVPALRQALYDRNKFVRWGAARALGRIGADQAAVAVPDLAHLAADPDLDVRQVAMGVLEQFGPKAAAAVPDLMRAASRGDDVARVAAIHALETIGKAAEPAIPALIASLSSEDARVLVAASEALARFGPAARAAAPALERLLNDPSTDVRQAASDAILSVTPTRTPR